MSTSSSIDVASGADSRSIFTRHPDNIVEIACIGDITIESAGACFLELRSTMQAESKYMLLLDLSQANPPFGETRHFLQERLLMLSKVMHIAVFNGNNYYLNLITQSLLGELEGVTTSIHANREDGLQLLQALPRAV